MFALTLIKELRLVENQTIILKTYKTCEDKTNDQCIKRHADIILRHFKMLNINLMATLNSQNPAKVRFIIPAPKYSLKPLSKLITSLFKLIVKQIENFIYLNSPKQATCS